MQSVHINLKETAGIERHQEPIRVGVPFKQGSVFQTTAINLKFMGGQPLPLQLTPTSYWPDGSYRWATITTAVSLAAYTSSIVVLQTGKRNQPASSHWNAKTLTVTSGNNTFELFGHALGWQRVSQRTSHTYTTQVEMTTANAEGCDQLLPTVLDKPWQCVEDGPVGTVLTTQGYWKTDSGQEFARFTCTLKFYHGNSTLSVELCAHNPKRARHPGGLWDLGDPGSIHFSSLAVRIGCPDLSCAALMLRPSDDERVYSELPLKLYQNSSGGENWNSRNHVDKNGEVTTQFRGFKITEQNKVTGEGLRASPNLRTITGNDTTDTSIHSVEVAYPLFWQNFPSALEATKSALIAHLFPANKNFQYELQGGEQKTQTIFISYGIATNTLTWTHEPLIPILTAQHYQNAGAFPWFNSEGNDTALDALINNGLYGSNNFFAKREVIDEFGWRNFGDIFADHETLYQSEGEPPFISHYNNQYDPIYGFARQFALTGDKCWFQLMDDLARHVVDIDIYHTNEDRAEYNNGLFWHTDHYLDAQTATHRTFSRLNDSSSTPGQTGGGPAEEHCYSTGLLYHHFLTGNEKSRQAVLDLARWMTALHESQDGFLEQLLAIKKREVPVLKRMIRGEHVSTHRYPFKRGTGNYLNTLMDAWVLDESGPWLTHAETVIRKTIHPADTIEHRNLLDVENRWSYLVLLASLFRYLYLKRQIDREDEHYEYTKVSLLRYTDWMLKNERPFLTDKAQLEFPNDTWVAQDVRKAMLMFQASELDPENSSQYQEKGHKWLEETTTTLQRSKEAQFTRILVILMQNHGPQSLTASSPLPSSGVTPQHNDWVPPVLTWRQLIARIATRALRAILTFRPSRERLWLNTRLDRS
ncbi:hypothetical protein HLV39_02810 [Marinobacter adhaerens]|uniref:PcRGLX/YetA-like N-terminal RIFT barrel domain-containing protein n=1 Tax=Marinobacter adhaerens TaxID=1033846 RepID=A0A851HNV5_9GAMM|nr:hypothetical protein [Marinobacter adhaerens]NWN90430.1 hypothetical protein [Marinobacter adhaerens]